MPPITLMMEPAFLKGQSQLGVSKCLEIDNDGRKECKATISLSHTVFYYRSRGLPPLEDIDSCRVSTFQAVDDGEKPQGQSFSSFCTLSILQPSFCKTLRFLLPFSFCYWYHRQCLNFLKDQ